MCGRNRPRNEKMSAYRKNSYSWNFVKRIMTKKFLLLFIFATFLVSSVTLFCIVWYLDPFQNPVISYTTLGVTMLLVSTSFLTMILYIFKNVYYR